MKNSFIYKSVIAFVILLSIFGVSIAGDNASISVSCSIPVVPGLNAPSIEEKIIESNATTTARQDIEIKKDPQKQEPTIIQESSEKILLADGNTSSVIVQTIYSR